jgi:hypothetical protein
MIPYGFCLFPAQFCYIIIYIWMVKSVCISRTSASKSQSHIATDGQSMSKSWCRALSGAHVQIYITLWHLRSCFCGAPTLTRGRVCLLYMLLALGSVVFVRSESLGIRDHILLSQILDFPFRRLLPLAGSRWRYSNLPPHEWLRILPSSLPYTRIVAACTTQHRKHSSSIVVETCYHAVD